MPPSRRNGHPGRGGLPHQGDFGGGEGVGLVDEVAERALQLQGLGGEGAGGLKAEGAGAAKGAAKEVATQRGLRPACFFAVFSGKLAGQAALLNTDANRGWWESMAKVE